MALKIRVSLGKRLLTLYDDNRAVKTWPVGLGKQATKTPTGTYTIINKVPNPGRRPGGPLTVYGTFWLGLSRKGYGIHGTNRPSSIGKYASNGCIRMKNPDVVDLAGRVAIGTPVEIVP